MYENLFILLGMMLIGEGCVVEENSRTVPIQIFKYQEQNHNLKLSLKPSPEMH